MAKKQRRQNEINASSMADIAFLLLIFFLVTTTMDTDKGILVTLPPWSEEPPPDDIIAKKREVLEILINSRDQLLVEGDVTQIEDLKDLTIKHVDNNGKLEDFSSSPQKAIVSLKNDRGTTYKAYLSVYDKIRAAYNQLRDNEAQRKFGKNYKDLTKENQRVVKDVYPLRLSEAEPEDFGAK